ncbi:uncharacterized protein LOC110914335 [Helianthus annuus]|uniref:uncharacterized protein LOC110914335 n=1 Tax=Helianthus annuus TaxID=4232 RepID=UPI000B8FCC9A|nr:uncharacterized protein LOC110914335 [Helianthus annuus]
MDKKIDNWMTKSLSFAGRLQLINSVLSSMHIFWAAVFIIPAHVTKDLEKRMRHFLWNKGRQGKVHAKVAWKEVCLPKEEGGLGIKSISDVNKALITNHIWSIISNRRSLWVQWIQSHNGAQTNAWSENWCQYSPLSSFISPQIIASAGFTLQSSVDSLFDDHGQWKWPQDWFDLFPVLINIDTPNLVQQVEDRLIWKDLEGTPRQFGSKEVWNNIRNRNSTVAWANLIWFPQCIPRHLFHMWLVWNNVKSMVDMSNVNDSWESIKDWMVQHANTKKIDHIVCKMVVAASTYFIWQERNNRFFSQNQSSVSMVTERIVNTIRLRVMGFNPSGDANHTRMLKKWKIPTHEDDNGPG